MQRIGRVNRIGTTAARIYAYNFFPTAKVDNDIELHKKALMKLQAFHSALGEDSQIYSEDEEFGTFGMFDRDFEEERDERLVFLMELRKFKSDNPEKFRPNPQLAAEGSHRPDARRLERQNSYLYQESTS